jgi:hypothetical protein
MTRLLSKLENRLGTAMLHLPDNLKKENWAEKVIIPDTLVTWSRYYPYEFRYTITPDMQKKDGWYLLDEEVFANCNILGVRNIDWGTFNESLFGGPYGSLDYMSAGYDIGDMLGLINQANVNSLFNNGIYINFEPPNRFRLESTYGAQLNMGKFDVFVLIEHSSNLTTISATQMETFESLAQADVASFLYNNLKYFQDLQTVFATVNLRLEDLERESQKRDDVINYIKESYVSASNKNQPYLYCI